MFEHQLSDETLKLIAQVIQATEGCLAIYGRNTWAVQTVDAMGRTRHLGFDPMVDSQFLRDELLRLIAGSLDT